MIKSTTAFILAGATDTRLHPLTKERCKLAVPFGGKYRLVDIPISNCLHSGLWKIFVLTQFNSFSLNQHIKNTYRFDEFSHGYVDILAAEQTMTSGTLFKGTADAVRQAYRNPELYESQHILILSGEQLYQMDYRKLLSAHKQTKATVTIAITPVTREMGARFGIIKTDDQGYVIDFIEKLPTDEVDKWKSKVPREMKEQGKEYLASIGIYVFDYDELARLLNDHPEALSFERDIIPMAVGSGAKVTSFPFTGYWSDLGTIRSFYEDNLGLTAPLPRIDLHNPRKTLFSSCDHLPPAKISGTTLERSIILEGCVIEAGRIVHSVIGCRSRIGEASTITNSIIMGSDHNPSIDRQTRFANSHFSPIGIGSSCTIENAIIDKNCRIGDNVRISGGDHLENQENEYYSIVDGIIVIPRGSIIPDNTTIPVESRPVSSL